MNYLKLVTIAFIATLSMNTFSSIRRVEVDGDLYLAHFKCSDEEKVLSEINEFITEVNDTEICTNETVEKVDNDNCRINLNSCLPKRLASKLGTTYPVSGPNCYGTSLYTTKNYKHVRFVSVDEFDAIVSSPYCRSLEKAEPAAIGHFSNDLGSIHAFTHVASNLTFERLGFDLGDDIYSFIANYTPNTTFKWEADSYCRQYAGAEKACYNKLNYVSCDLSSFFFSLPSNTKKDLEDLESLVNTLVLNQNEYPKDAISSAREMVKDLKQAVTSIKESDRKIFDEMLNSMSDQVDSAERFHNK